MIRYVGPVVLPFPLLLLFLFLVSTCTAQPPPKFRCSSKSKCQALAGYVAPRETTYEAIRGLFQVEYMYDLYEANNLDMATPESTKVPANTTIRIPFTCVCANGIGASDRRPIYAVNKGDSLETIARERFGGLVTYQQIAAANRIANASVVNAGQRLFIPLPCSCDQVDYNTVHLAHVVENGSTLANLSSMFWTSQASLISLNNISDPKNLLAGQVLDVPLSACFSPPRMSYSREFYLVLPNDSYALTVRKCIKCTCNSPATEMPLYRSSDIMELCTLKRNFEEAVEFSETFGKECRATKCLYARYNDPSIFVITMVSKFMYCGPSFSSVPSGAQSVERGLLLRWPRLLPLFSLGVSLLPFSF